MASQFWNGALVTSALYGGVVLSAWLLDFRVALFALAALQFVWTLPCLARSVQLRLRRSDPEPWDAPSYGFAAGAALSSCVLLLAVVVWSQVV